MLLPIQFSTVIYIRQLGGFYKPPFMCQGKQRGYRRFYVGRTEEERRNGCYIKIHRYMLLY